MSKSYCNQDYSELAHFLSTISDEDELTINEDISKRGLFRFVSGIDNTARSPKTKEKVRGLFELAQILQKEEPHAK